MSAEIIPFDFEEQAVRVVMRGEEPWFAAADVCRVLELGNTSQAVSRLDDDERDGIISNDTAGRSNRLTIINESGLYALILTSRKPEARRFRKWITAEVLPALRQHGRYEMPAAHPYGDVGGLPLRECEIWLQMVREARLSRGPRAAIRIWDGSPLPRLTGTDTTGRGFTAQDGQACLDKLLEELGELIDLARARHDPNDDLAREGLRCLDDGLYVASFALPALAGTAWSDGRHRLALMALPGVQPGGGRTLSLKRCKGLIVPWQLIDREAA